MSPNPGLVEHELFLHRMDPELEIL